MKLPVKSLLKFSLTVVICLLVWNAIWEDDPFVWTWQYVLPAYTIPIIVYFIGIFLLASIGYLLWKGIEKVAATKK